MVTVAARSPLPSVTVTAGPGRNGLSVTGATSYPSCSSLPRRTLFFYDAFSMRFNMDRLRCGLHNCSSCNPPKSHRAHSLVPLSRGCHFATRCSTAQPLCLAASSTVDVGPCWQDTQQQQQVMPWYNQPHAEELREVLQMPPYRFQTFIQHEPSILGFRADTLALTAEALADALDVNRTTLMRVLEQRPGILCQPHEPVTVLHQLAHMLGRTTQQTAFLLNPYPQLLALQPEMLQQRVQELCTVMHWPHEDAQQSPLAAVAVAGAPAYLHLLAAPLHRKAQQLSDLSVALGVSKSTCACLVQHRTVLLDMSPAVVRSSLFLLADYAGVTCQQLIAQLDDDQARCLAGLLLLSPARLHQQLNALSAVLQPTKTLDQIHLLTGSTDSPAAVDTEDQQQKHMLVHLLLCLGGPVGVAQAAVTMVALRGIVRTNQAWQQELDAALSDKVLAVFLTAGSEALAQARYLQHVGGDGRVFLKEVLSCPAEEFRQSYGVDYMTWLTGRI